MLIVFRGRRYRVIQCRDDEVVAEPVMRGKAAAIAIAYGDPHLIASPTDDDVLIAQAYERGEISAFEYADGSTYPPGREIVSRHDAPAARVH